MSVRDMAATLQSNPTEERPSFYVSRQEGDFEARISMQLSKRRDECQQVFFDKDYCSDDTVARSERHNPQTKSSTRSTNCCPPLEGTRKHSQKVGIPRTTEGISALGFKQDDDETVSFLLQKIRRVAQSFKMVENLGSETKSSRASLKGLVTSEQDATTDQDGSDGIQSRLVGSIIERLISILSDHERWIGSGPNLQSIVGADCRCSKCWENEKLLSQESKQSVESNPSPCSTKICTSSAPEKTMVLDDPSADGGCLSFKYPLKALVGQNTLVGEEELKAQQSAKGGDRHRQNSLISSVFDKKASSTDAKTSSASQETWWSLVVRKVQSLMKKAMYSSNSADEVDLTVGPYISFLWISNLGVMDVLLVGILLFWPDQDFMCTYNYETALVTQQKFIISAIGVVLFMNTGDVISRIYSRDPAGRRVGLNFFNPKALGGKGQALFNMIDVLTIIGSALVACANSSLCGNYLADDSDSWPYRIVKKLHIMISILRCILGIKKCIESGMQFRRQLQRAVSTNKRRFVDPENKLDLDLTYICDRVIAMGIPCVEGAIYRNDIQEVARFFATRHYGRFLVFNLCEDFETKGNGCYDCMLLYDQVQKLPFRDHNAPSLRVLVGFCRQAVAWLNENPANVVAIHCQGGKGRTGTFCSSLMLWCGFCKSADDALSIFEHRRTDTRIDSKRSQGVTSPSQRRYVHYLERVLQGHDCVSPKRMLITSISLNTLPLYKRQTVRVAFIIESFGVIQYDYGKRHGISKLSRCEEGSTEDSRDVFRFEIEDILVAGDVAVRFYVFEEDSLGPAPGGALGPGARTIKYGSVTGKEIFFVTFHTSFHDERIEFRKHEIDGAHGKPSTVFDDNFSMEVTFQSWNERRCKSLRLASFTSFAQPGGSQQMQSNKVENVPYGMSSGPRLIRLHEIVDEIMIAACPEVMTFRRGELLNTPVGEQVQKGRSVFLIISGVAEYQFLNPDQNRAYDVNRGDSIAGLQIGTGEFYGVSDFVLGKDGCPSSFCLRASTDIVQVRALRFDDKKGGYTGIVPATCNKYQAWQLSVFFELLARSASAKARDFAMHISKLSIKPSNIKRAHQAGTGHAHIVQKILKELEGSTTNAYVDRFISMAPAICISESGQRTRGYLLIFSNQMVFYVPQQFRRQGSHVKYFFKDITRVSSTGGELVVFLSVDKEGDRSQKRRRASTLGLTSSHPRSMERTSSGPLSVPSFFRNSPRSIWNLVTKSISRARSSSSEGDHAFGTSTSNMPTETSVPAHIRFDLGDSNVCSETESLISGRLLETRITPADYQADPSKASADDENADEMMFGYLLPEESASDEDRAAVQQIFMLASTFRYAPGDDILPVGSIERNLFHIVQGTVACMGPSGQVLARMGPGEIFGEISFLDTGDSGAAVTVLAETEVICLVVAHDRIEMLNALQPLVGVRFWRNLAASAAIRLRRQYRTVKSMT